MNVNWGSVLARPITAGVVGALGSWMVAPEITQINLPLIGQSVNGPMAIGITVAAAVLVGSWVSNQVVPGLNAGRYAQLVANLAPPVITGLLASGLVYFGDGVGGGSYAGPKVGIIAFASYVIGDEIGTALNY